MVTHQQPQGRGNKMTTAIFLGAGASAAEGAPIQSALFKQYFASPNVQKESPMYRDLAQFFESVFGINLAKPIADITFPTFEEALGILDLAEARKESLRGFSVGAPPTGVQLPPHANRVQLLRLDLILVMAKAIDEGLRRKRKPGLNGKAGPHQVLVKNLKKLALINDTIFISTNYDLCIDEALANSQEYERDYAVDFDESGAIPIISPQAITVRLFKLHGSLNWLYCPVCNNVKRFGTKAALSLAYQGRTINQCGFCDSILSPVIVPPTFYKDMSRVFLSSIWNKAEDALREVDHVIFCGYSLPDADMHIKYLLKRMQTNRTDPESVRFTLVNHHKTPPKKKKDADIEEQRYLRFLGKRVKDTRSSFEKFAKDPGAFYEMGK
ncbi:MAG TPA: SIR2 family protein [Pyrinomonadaceae bacterium]|nr:SIR2 family protein [Pyrinomonadaceae bacterium]